LRDDFKTNAPHEFAMQYITIKKISSRRSPGTGYKVEEIPEGFVFDPVEVRGDWLAISLKQWIPASACKRTDLSIEPPADITTQFITLKRVAARRNPGGGWNMGYIPEGFAFNPIDEKNGWLAINKNKWIPAYICKRINPPPDPPPDHPPDPPADPLPDGIWYTIRGDQKTKFYKPEGMNIGSFDIAWLLDEKPVQRVYKPASMKLSAEHIDYLIRLNGVEVLNWLVSQGGTDKILSVDEIGVYRCPVPCMSGNNQVMVLEWDNRFARIETVNIHKPIPKYLPPWLCHTWWGFAESTYYMIASATGGIKYPLFAKGDSAWVQRSGLVSVTDHLLSASG
jgi:hypothetical protein